MFDKAIIDTDRFMDLSMSSKALYFLLGMEADDEGFVSYKKVMRIHGGNEDDLKVLVAKKFLIIFESGVVVITDWNTNNYLDKNRTKETEYQKEKSMLLLTNLNKYELNTGLTSIEESRGVDREKPSVFSLPSGEEELEIIPTDEEGNPLKVKKPKKKLSPVEFSQRASEIRERKLKSFNYEDELQKLRESTWKPNKIVALVWTRKGYHFDNAEQFAANHARDVKLAKSLEGYSANDIHATIDFCEKEASEVGYTWGVATIAKKIANIINR